MNPFTPILASAMRYRKQGWMGRYVVVEYRIIEPVANAVAVSEEYMKHIAIVLSVFLMCTGCHRSKGIAEADTEISNSVGQPTDAASSESMTTDVTSSHTNIDTDSSTTQPTDDRESEIASDAPPDTGEVHSNCFEGNHVIQTQTDIDRISMYSCISGTLTIESSDLETVSLPNLRYVDANLEISGNSRLVAFSMPALIEIGNDLVVGCPDDAGNSDQTCANPVLTSTSGLENLERIAGSVTFVGNDSLPSLQGMENLKVINGRFLISMNTDLRFLTGLVRLNHIEGDLIIRYNHLLSEVTGFANLTTVGGTLQIEGNSSLYTLRGLQKIVEIGKDFILGSGSQLESLPLSSLTTVGENFILYGHYRLSDVSGLSSLISIGGDVTISWLEAITDLNFLSGITQIHGNLELSYLGLKNFTGLENLVVVSGALIIAENDYMLENLSGLNNLQSVGSGISIYNNYALVSLQQLESLTSVGELEDGEDIRIVRNKALPNCEICNLISRLSSTSEENEIWIESNADDACGSKSMTFDDLHCP